jgi:hypothetical protein
VIVREERTVNASAKTLLSYREHRAQERKSPLFQREVPLEHYKSLPLPTLRWGGPAFAAFACPARRAPRRPLVVNAPDRWWATSAHGGRLQVYAVVAALPFTDTGLSASVTIESPAAARTVSLADQKRHLETVEVLLDAAAAAFFAGKAATAETGAALAEALRLVIPEPLEGYYRALAPDFYSWLRG